MSYDDSNSGVLFRETEKKNPKAPDYKGKLNVDGRPLEVAGWIRESKAGNKFLSIKVQEPRQKQEKPKVDARPAPSFADEPDDALPF